MATASVYRTHRLQSPLTLFLPIPLLTQQRLPLSSPRDLATTTSSPWVSLPLLSGLPSSPPPPQVSSPLSSFPPLPAPAFPFVCCCLWFVSHCGLASHLALENLHFSFLYPDHLALERLPLPGSLSGPRGGAPAWLPSSHHRTINQPFSSLFGAFSAHPLPLRCLPSSSVPPQPPSHSQPISALAHSALLALPGHTP